MKVKIRLYALLKDLYGLSEEVLEFNEDRVSVEKILQKISEKNDKIRDFMRSRGESIIILLNGVYAPPDTLARDGDTLDLLPPASGGS
ncbi:MAG: MoaD/ThiS family protein [Desulfurococcaceae archaeon]|nr:MoaD/ThiS family protein [Desulfurococcaceae archaeon]